VIGTGLPAGSPVGSQNLLVRCAVAPGWIDADLNRDLIGRMPDSEAFTATLPAFTLWPAPAGR
jgi:hypothetical protein